jgi:hypothetical protein
MYFLIIADIVWWRSKNDEVRGSAVQSKSPTPQNDAPKNPTMKAVILALALAASGNALTPREELAKSVNDLKTTWTAKVGSDANKPLHSSRHLYGVLPENEAEYALLPKVPKLTREEVEAMDIPDAFDSAENWPQCANVINDIRDQSNCGNLSQPHFIKIHARKK